MRLASSSPLVLSTPAVGIELTKTRFRFANDAEPGDPAIYQFTRKLLREGEHYRVGPFSLVVEKGYLSPARLESFGKDLIAAHRSVREVLGPNAAKPSEIVVYVYDIERNGFISQAHIAGLNPGRTGLLLAKVAEGTAPIEHELAHQLVDAPWPGTSLGEGLADYIHYALRPGQESAFRPAGLNEDKASLAALEKYGPGFQAAIGAPGEAEFASDDYRHSFYYASHSFVKFLIDRCGGRERFFELYRAGGTQDAYQATYGQSLGDLQAKWKAAL